MHIYANICIYACVLNIRLVIHGILYLIFYLNLYLGHVTILLIFFKHFLVDSNMNSWARTAFLSILKLVWVLYFSFVQKELTCSETF